MDGSKSLGLAIAFTADVFVADPGNPGGIAHEINDHVFQVIVDRSTKQDAGWGLWCRCNVHGLVIPVEVHVNPDGLILDAREVPPVVARAAAFILPDGVLDRINRRDIGELWVTLHGDFVMDAVRDNANKWVPNRAIDAEFVRADLPTGDRPKGSDVGVQGGTFHSWFAVKGD